jgi:DNA adenine methylase
MNAGKVCPPLKWAGGKCRMADKLLPMIPPHSVYVEVCAGGAGLFWCKPRDWSRCEVLNDVDGDLVNFYRVLSRHGRRMAWEVARMPYSRELFNKLKKDRPRSEFARARNFWFVNQIAFGAIMRTPDFAPRTRRPVKTLSARPRECIDAIIARLDGVILENLDFARVVHVYDRPDTFFYIDPPYYDVKDLYVKDFAEEDHARLAKGLRGIRGVFLLSYNNHPVVRRLYRRCAVKRFEHRYSMRESKKVIELVISNRPIRLRTDIQA